MFFFILNFTRKNKYEVNKFRSIRNKFEPFDNKRQCTLVEIKDKDLNTYKINVIISLKVLTSKIWETS